MIHRRIPKAARFCTLAPVSIGSLFATSRLNINWVMTDHQGYRDLDVPVR
jgi:protein gp37